MDRQELEEGARRILLTNLRRGVADWNGKEFSFVVPSLRGYPFQWFWDSCFHAIALTHLDREQAKAELTTLMSGALPNGFIPHIIFWEMDKQPDFLSRNIVGMTSPYYSSTMQPPIIAYAVERVYQATGDEAFKERALPILTAYYRWVRENRDPDNDGLIAVIQPEEAGTDCSPKYDEVLGLEELSNQGFIARLKEVYAAYEPMRGNDRRILAADIFHIEDVLVNSIYAFGLRALVRLLGDGPEAAEFSREGDRTLEALLSKCWDEDAGAFFDLSGVAEKPLQVVTISSLMPLILDDLPRPVVERLVSRWVTSTDDFWLPYPIPSVPASNPKFTPGNPRGFIWRGPSWINTNWFLSHALRRHGYADLADTIVARSHECVEKSGFREYYHPYTAEGLGARDFGWSTLILDM
jgi:glycogen debranching enzyme